MARQVSQENHLGRAFHHPISYVYVPQLPHVSQEREAVFE